MNTEDRLKREFELMRDSGVVKLDGRLISFIYELVRDNITPGQLEGILKNCETKGPVTYTNGYLAKYAENVAKFLTEN